MYAYYVWMDGRKEGFGEMDGSVFTCMCICMFVLMVAGVLVCLFCICMHAYMYVCTLRMYVFMYVVDKS